MNAAVTPAEKAAIFAHYSAQAAQAVGIAESTKRDRVALVCIAGAFECDARFSIQQGAIYLTALCFDTVNWIDPAEFLLPSAIALIESDIAETLREFGE